jgi:nicotinamidase-related amidase
MLMDRDRCTLLIIDVQTKLLPVIHDGQAMLEHCVWLVHLASRMGVPVLGSEQYPKGMGPTVAALAELLPPETFSDKLHFSCVAGQCLAGRMGDDRSQIVVCGIETHVCVLQSALELRAQGREVYVVEEAVGSRRPSDKTLALERMRQEGVRIVSREMVAFEWLRVAGTELFKDVSKSFLR